MINIPKAKSSVHVIIPITPLSFESGAKKITPEVGETAYRYW